MDRDTVVVIYHGMDVHSYWQILFGLAIGVVAIWLSVYFNSKKEPR